MTDGNQPRGDKLSENTDETVTQYASTAGKPLREHDEQRRTARRRRVLDALSGQTTPIELEELAIEIATQETGATPPPMEVVTKVKIDLHHARLPKLDDEGVLDYNPESNVVEPTDPVAGSDDTDASLNADPTDDRHSDNEFRRLVVEYFDASISDTASLDDLTRYAAARYTDADDWSAKRVHLWLHHAVLPKLNDHGLVGYNPETTMARYPADSS